MTREELLELAALDAFGLLDDYEAALFTRSFHHAPAAVQDEIKELQAAFAADPAFLPEVEPREELRSRVLGAVARAVESESGELAPLALIGRTQSPRGRAVTRPVNGASSHFWRAAALVLAAGNIVFAYFGIQFHRDFVAVTTKVLQDHTLRSAAAEIGGEFFTDYVGNPNCEKVVLTSADGTPMTAWVYVKEHPDVGGCSVFVFTQGLPVSTELRLVGELNDEVAVDLEFRTSAGPISGARVDVGTVSNEVYTEFAKVSWKLIDTGANEVVLSYSA